jgi:hypothetical protein
VELSGWRAVWGDKVYLGVAHLVPSTTPILGDDALADQIMVCGTTRHGDHYMEVHIFGEVSWQSLSKVTLEKPLTAPEDQDDWDFGRMKLELRGVRLVSVV